MSYAQPRSSNGALELSGHAYRTIAICVPLYLLPINLKLAGVDYTPYAGGGADSGESWRIDNLGLFRFEQYGLHRITHGTRTIFFFERRG